MSRGGRRRGAGRPPKDGRKTVEQAPPAPTEKPESQPHDVRFSKMTEVAAMLGVTPPTLSNWGVKPYGKAPWSLLDFMQRLRTAGYLGRCRPAPKAHDLFTWVWLGSGDLAINPDDPAHPPPIDWNQEGERQRALKAKEERLREQIRREVDERERIPIEAYRRRFRRRAHQVLQQLQRFLTVPAKVPDLTPAQRDALTRALKDELLAARAAIGAGPADGYATAPRQPDVDAIEEGVGDGR